mgnify:CR=1 FL=1
MNINSNTLNKTSQTLLHNNNNDIICQSTNNATYEKALKNEDNQCIIQWKKVNNSIIFPVAGFAQFLVNTYNSDAVIFCTEYVRAGTQYRCHPKYGKHGAYYHCLLVKYDDDMDYLCKSIACIPGEDKWI